MIVNRRHESQPNWPFARSSRIYRPFNYLRKLPRALITTSFTYCSGCGIIGDYVKIGANPQLYGWCLNRAGVISTSVMYPQNFCYHDTICIKVWLGCFHACNNFQLSSEKHACSTKFSRFTFDLQIT
jgi:hypothetical protein